MSWAQSVTAEVVYSGEATAVEESGDGDERAKVVVVKLRDCATGEDEEPCTSAFVTMKIGQVEGEQDEGSVDVLHTMQAGCHPRLASKALVEAMRDMGCALLVVRRMHMAPSDFEDLEGVATSTPPPAVAETLARPDAYFAVLL